MRTLWLLLKKDLLRDARHPMGLVVSLVVPVLMAIIISLVFSPNGNFQENVTVHVAVLDEDDDILAGVLRSVSNQGQGAENLRFHLVDNEADGIRLVERREVSAFVVLPERLTLDLLEGEPTALTLYKNPAESILPVIVEEALEIICVSVSEGLRLLRPEIKQIRVLIDREEMPKSIEVAEIASSAVERLETVEPYLFPPLIQLETIDATEYMARARQEPPENEGDVP